MPRVALALGAAHGWIQPFRTACTRTVWTMHCARSTTVVPVVNAWPGFKFGGVALVAQRPRMLAFRTCAKVHDCSKGVTCENDFGRWGSQGSCPYLSVGSGSTNCKHKGHELKRGRDLCVLHDWFHDRLPFVWVGICDARVPSKRPMS